VSDGDSGGVAEGRGLASARSQRWEHLGQCLASEKLTGSGRQLRHTRSAGRLGGNRMRKIAGEMT
jgi:hypothetical protein